MQPDKISDVHSIPLINGVSEITDNYDAFIIDIWGVVHDGAKLYPYTKEVLQKLNDLDKKCLFLSNTDARPQEMEMSLRNMGLKIFQDDVVTAGGSAHRGLREYQGKKCIRMATFSNEEIMQGIGLEVTESPNEADFILNTIGTATLGQDRHFYEIMEECLEERLPMVCANPDHEVSISNRIYHCAGLYAQWYEDNGGKVEWHGKPYLPIYEWAWEKLGKIDKSKICAIGDSLRTDITGAKNFGIDSLWNLDGTTADLSLKEANQRASDKNLKPIGILRGFYWG